MLIKIHKATRYVVAVCDSELIGKKFVDADGIRQIDLTGTFFKGEEKNSEEIKEFLLDMKLEDASFNIVGKESCSIAVDIGLVEKEEVMTIADIPMVLILL